MFSRSILTLAILSACAPAFAETISGTVVDEQGKPVSGAQITVEGSRKSTLTDEQGRYQLNDISPRDVHIHVSSNAYLHGDNDLGRIDGDQVVDFTLTPASMENILVTATAMQSSTLESVTPVSVLGAEELRRNQAPTLGETLKNTPGVQSTYFGPVSSSPVIRGNDGPRVMIVQNGLNISDVSRVGPDHNVAANASSATQVEILRGPATLQYGSGAIGGVVNVVDQRIPQYVPDDVEGEAEVRYSTVDNGKFGKLGVTGGQGKIAYHFDGFMRKTQDVDIPGYASTTPDGDAPYRTLENSDMDTKSFTAGASYVEDEGYIGFAVEKLSNLYGVPGHHHHHEEEHDLMENDGHDEAESGTQIDVDMTRYQMMGEWHSPVAGFNNIKFGLAHTDYTHVEVEDGVTGTEFNNDSTNFSLSANHIKIDGWHGVIGLQASTSDYEAIGEEAFTPPNTTDSYALYLVEQKRFNNVTVELGGRVERTSYDADDAQLDLHAHHEEAGEAQMEPQTFTFDDYDFTSTSLSAGANWEYIKGQSVALTLSRSERAPSQQELFAGGPHLATQTYEVGLLYDLDEEGELASQLRGVQEEVSNNIDLTLRKFTGDWGYTVSLFYNQADNYIYQTDTGLRQEEEHADEAGEEIHDHEEEGLPVYAFNQADADIYGLEGQVYYDFTPQWRVEVFGDTLRAKLDDQDLPRIPQSRIGTSLSYQGMQLRGDIGVTYHASQDHIAPFETETDSFTMLSAGVEYEISHRDVSWILFANADNLTNEEARVHTSFLKDEAPLPGRNFTVGARAVF